MSRSRRTSNPVLGVLLGLALPLGALVLVFSLVPYDYMLRDQPLGISAEEVSMFQRWFDLRPKEAGASVADVVRSRTAGKRWWFAWDDRQDTVEAKPADGVLGAWIVTFPANDLFRGARSVLLLPAGPSTIRYAYAHAIADSLGVAAPAAHPVRWERDGKDVGVFVALERIGAEYLEQHGMPDARVVRIAADGRTIDRVNGTPEESTAAERAWRKALHGDPEAVDTNAAALVQVLREAYPQPFQDQRALLAFDRSRGRMVPLIGETMTRNVPAFPGAVATWHARLVADTARWERGFAAVDAQWAAAFAEGNSLGMARARLRGEHERMLEDVLREPAAVPAPVHVPAQELDPWLKGFLGADDTIRIRRGAYAIDHDIEVPVGRAVVIERSVRLRMAANTSLIVNGALHIRGTAVNPVFVRAEDLARPFGTICVNGDGHTPCVIKGLRISGGSTAWAGERYHSAMLSFHDCAVALEGCAFGASYGEDAVNLKRCTAHLTECDLREAKDDLLDLDQVNGDVTRCTFAAAAAGDSALIGNGDGLDASASRLVITGCSFQGLRDKGVSAGEQSRVLVQGSTFSGCGIGIAAKDGSVAHVSDCDLNGNATALAAFRKKPIFDGGSLMLYGNRLQGNGHDQAIDSASHVGSSERIGEDVRLFFHLVGSQR